METILYRNTKLDVKTIPKGTLLFRLTKTPLNDTKGVPIENNKRCITPNFNVFFHPNPFIGFHMYNPYLKTIGTNLSIYVLSKDIKVLWLVNPSKYNRLDYNKKRFFIKRCSTVKKGCMPKQGNDWDPCLAESIIKKHPEIVGILANSAGDQKYLKAALKRGISNKTQKVFHKAKDSFGISSVPELILHPLTKRPSADIIDSTFETNYKLLKTIPYDEKKLHEFMENKTEYDPSTFFFKEKSRP